MLEETLKKLDNSIEYIDEHSVENELIKLLNELEARGNNDEIKLARLNYEFIQFVLKVDKGVLAKFTGTDKEGNTHHIPDIDKYQSFEFEYLKKRFDETNNPYLKGVYGLILVLSENEESKPYKSNQIALQTCQSLFELCKIYKENIDKEHFFDIYLINSVYNCIGLAERRKFNECIDQVNDFVVSSILFSGNADNILLEFLRAINKYFNLFSKDKDIQNILQHSLNLCRKSDSQKSLLITEIAKIALELSQKLNSDQNEWLELLAKKYEFMAEEGRENQRTDVSYHLENALTYYKQLGNKEKIEELELQIDESKKNVDLQTVKTKLPKEYVQKIRERNKRVLKEDSDTIIHFLTSTIFLSPLPIIKEIAESTYDRSFITSISPIAPMDKYGNTLAKFIDGESKKEFNIAQTYNNNLQIGMITIGEVLSMATKQGKLNSTIFMDHLKSGWIGHIKTFKYADGEKEVDLAKILEPSIKLIFAEISNLASDKDISIDNLVLAIDSLTTKMEYLIRYLGFILKIPSFKYVRNEYHEEKNIYDYFREPKIKEFFSKDDLYFLRHFLTEKATGLNLRGRVSHGLLDYDEYGIDDAMLLLIALLKIGNKVFE